MTAPLRPQIHTPAAAVSAAGLSQLVWGWKKSSPAWARHTPMRWLMYRNSTGPPQWEGSGGERRHRKGLQPSKRSEQDG